ncbi:MAG: ferrous iron transport protein A [Flavobacteriaceae bacterium]|nr:ferrous iron transport protein A [Flavobacteriaceae bacterium]
MQNYDKENLMENKQTIFDLKPGDSGRISGFSSEEIPMKFYELGLIPGSFVTLKKRLPFGGPVCIQLLDSANLIALRSTEARSILIDKFL